MLAMYIYHFLYVMKTRARQTRSFTLNVSVEGAHAMSTGKMLHIRIVRGTKEVQIWVM